VSVRAEPGDLLRTFSSLYRKKSDPRLNPLIDAATVLRGGDKVARTNAKSTLRVSRLTDDEGAMLFFVEAERDGKTDVVFSGAVQNRQIEFKDYHRGPWEKELETWAKEERVR